MPALPAQTEKLENGIHKLTCISVRTIEGKYGPQEEATCMVGDTDKQTRVWISHSSYRQVKAAAEAGLVKIDEDTEEWNVVVGARFAAVVAGGKIIGLMPIDD